MARERPDTERGEPGSGRQDAGGSRPVRPLPDQLNLGKPVPLFVWKGEMGRRVALERGMSSRFDVSADGQRFLAVVPQVVVDELPLFVVINWPAEIPR